MNRFYNYIAISALLFVSFSWAQNAPIRKPEMRGGIFENIANGKYNKGACAEIYNACKSMKLTPISNAEESNLILSCIYSVMSFNLSSIDKHSTPSQLSDYNMAKSKLPKIDSAVVKKCDSEISK